MPAARRPLVVALLAVAAAAACPGAQPACPYTASASVGQAGGGVLRFPQAVAVAGDGTVYVGDEGSHLVQAFDASGRWLRDIGRPGTRLGELTSVGALTLAGDGSLLVASGTDRIHHFTPGGTLLGGFGRPGTGIGEFHFGSGHANDGGAGGGLAVSGGRLFVSDTSNDRILRFSLDGTNGVEIIAPGTVANPKGLAVRGSRLYVADDQHHRVLVTDAGGRTLTSIGKGNGTGPGQLNFPYGVALDGAGRVFVADDLNHRVVRFSTAPAYPYKARFGSYGTQPGQLAYPRGIATDGAGALYVANTGNDRIEVFDRTGAYQRSFGTSGRGPGQYSGPTGVAADSSGVRAVADTTNGRVQLLGPDGALLASWGSPAPGPTILPQPVSVAFDAAGNAYVLDQRRARILVFDRATGLPARSIASQGSGPGQLLDPSALAIDAEGIVTVADTGNARLARFRTDGTYVGSTTQTGAVRSVAVTPDGSLTYAAVGNTVGAYDAAGTQTARFGGTGTKLGKLNAPGQMALDVAGNLWVADRGNNRVQQFGPEGQRLLTFGVRGAGAGEFVHPTGVAIDCQGGLTVTDTDNARVQRFQLAAPSAPACRTLPAPGTPPPPKTPTRPAPDGPVLSVRALRTSGALRTTGLPFRAGCDTSCSVTLTLRLTPRKAPVKKRGRKAETPVVVTATLAAQPVPGGESRVLRIAPSSAQATRLRKALRGARGLSGQLVAVATATTGSPTTSTLEVRLTS